MNIKLAVVLGLIIVILVVAYFLIFEEWSWKKVITWIIGISAAISPLLLIDNYRIFIIAIIVAILFECKNLSRR